MNETLKKILTPFGAFFGSKKIRRFLYLLAIGALAFNEFSGSGLVRRTYVFYSTMEGNLVVEDRILRRSELEETEIRRYVEEALLGPISPGLDPLFPRETRLISFMLRDGTVYLNLSEPAALPLPDGGDVYRSILTLNEGIRRNFSRVGDVKIFIGGNEVFFEEFRGKFANSADNTETSP